MDRPPNARSAEASTTTGDDGRFFLGCAEPGKVGVYTVKEDKYYPDTMLTPFIDPKFTAAVGVVNQRVTRGVQVHLPPKGGRLTVQVRDARSQQPIDGATMTICRSDTLTNPPGPKCRVMTNLTRGNFSMLLPALTYAIKASAPGFKDSYYGSDSAIKHSSVIRLRPEATKSILIPLMPKD